MLHDTPLRSRHEAILVQETPSIEESEKAPHRPGAAVGHQLEPERVEYLPYGPVDDEGMSQCEIVGAFDIVELEYAALRRGAGLFDASHRGTLLITGNDRLEFLDNMLTQKLGDMQANTARESFWLSRVGRIEADLFLLELGDRIVIDVDIHQAASTTSTLDQFIFTEDVSVQDVSDSYHHLALHGPAALEILQHACKQTDLTLEPGQAKVITINDIEVIAARRDQIGDTGIELIMPYDGTGAVWDALLTANDQLQQDKQGVRPVGWYAYNTARIEGGTPLFNIDFTSENLPHETGLLHKRVDFEKGCYLGQEVVARIESYGAPKRQLAGLLITEGGLPSEGAAVYRATESNEPGDQVGLVTSSTLSPMRSAQPVAFATLQYEATKPETKVFVEAEGTVVHATVSGLSFWSA